MNDNSMNNMNENIPELPGDTIVGNLIADVLSNRKPPDLTQRILARFQNLSTTEDDKRQAIASFTDREREAAVLIAEHDLMSGYGANCLPLPMINSKHTAQTQWFRRFLMVVSTLAALLLVGLFIGVLLFLNGTPQNENKLIGENSSSKKEQSSIAEFKNNDATDKTLTPPHAEERSSVANDIEKELPATNRVADADKVPNQSSSSSRNVVASSSSKTSVQVLSDSAIVDVINEQFQQLWTRTGLMPRGKIKTDDWIERATVSIIGRQPTAAERESFRANRSENRESDFIEKLLGSGEFARHWADVLAEHYLGNRVIGSRNQASPQRQFVNWLADKISKQAFIGDIEREMLVGKGADTEVRTLSSSSQDPASFWISEILEPSELGAGKLTVPTKSMDPKLESQLRAARQLLRVCGNTPMVCAQCHEPNKENGVTDFLAFSPTKDSGTSGTPDFWKVTASLSGFAFSRNDRVLTRKPPKDKFFYEDAGGRMQMVNPGPPSVQMENKFESLGDWIATSMDARNAVVDVVWSKVFGQPLVPIFGLTDDEGKDERVDLRDMLASQIQSGHRDIASLIRWMVHSRPFLVEGNTIDSQWYLRSTESQLADTQRAMRLFAASSATTPVAQEYGKIAMNRIIGWLESKKTFENNSIVAQPSPNSATANSQARPKPNYSEDQIRFLVSVSNPYARLDQLAERLANSPLSVEEILDHTFLVSDARFPLQTERENANKVFELSGKDRKKAILMLIQGRLGPY